MTRPPETRVFLEDGEIIVDSFAGGGGASVGIELALGRSPDIAINHDAEAIALHAANHPGTQHYNEDVWKVDPVEACKGRRVGVMWLSPDCKHFSKAKGGKPVSPRVRGLAWVAVRWAKAVKPRIIVLENVEEFQTWGPLKDDRPDPARKGRTFKMFVGRLRGLGYTVEWRELRACDYGAPTIRKRLFLVARCDGQAIVWPKPTHGRIQKCHCGGTFEREVHEALRSDSQAGRDSEKLDRQRTGHGASGDRTSLRVPLENAGQGHRDTERTRVSEDLHHNERPQGHPDGASDRVDFAARDSADRASDQPPGWGEDEQQDSQSGVGHGSNEQHARQIDWLVDPAPRDSERVCQTDGRAGGTDQGRAAGRRGEHGHRAPVRSHTLVCTSCGRRQGAQLEPWLTAATCIDFSLPCPSIFGRKKDLAVNTQKRITAGLKRFVFEADRPFIVNMSHGGSVESLSAPMTTIKTEKGGCRAIVQPFLAPLTHHGGESRVGDLTEPMKTVTGAHRGETAYIAPVLVPRYGEREGQEPRAQTVEKPLSTIVPTQNGASLCAAFLAKHQSERHANEVQAASLFDCVPTVKSRDSHALVTSHLEVMHGTSEERSVEQPAPAVLAQGNHLAEIRAFLVAYYGNEKDGGDLFSPMRTVTSKERFGLVTVEGVDYQLVDIGMRMLAPRELYKAQGFPDSYRIEIQYNGKPLSKTAQVRMCGNSVCPDVAAAIIRSNVAPAQARGIAA